jgi:O-antigen/teichoic acid export membrane protein
MKTKVLVVSSTLSGFLKIIIGISLLNFGHGSVGILLGIFSMYLLDLLVCSISVNHSLSTASSDESDSEFTGTTGEVFKAGMPAYIPGTIQTLGSKIGVLIVFGTIGAIETGYYYIAFQLYAVIILISTSIMGFLFPYVSGMGFEKHSILRKGIRIAEAISAPIVFALLLYPDVPLLIFGESYIAGSTMFRVLLASVPLLIVTTGTNTLVYSDGKYRVVLLLGLSINLPRLILYFVLTPPFGGIGASISFTIGSTVGFLVALIIANRHSFSIDGYRIAQLVSIPLLISAPFYFINVPWFVGSLIIILLSIILYLRLGALQRDDAVELIDVFLPKAESSKIRSWLFRLMDIMSR